MWQLKNISNFNVHENAALYMFKFITTQYQLKTFHRVSSFCTLISIIYKIYYAE